MESSPLSPKHQQDQQQEVQQQPQQQPQPQTKDTLLIQKKIGRGKFTVYRVSCPAHKNIYALKVFPKHEFGIAQFHKEKLIAKLNHPNIIKYIPIKCHTEKFFGLVTEYVARGDLFNPVVEGALAKETIARAYFRQLIEGIEYIHSQGIAHLDLKLENLMLGSDFKLKIIDFDQAQNISDNNITSGGTLCYRAPEVAKADCKDLASADIYSAGVVLYTFVAREYPFLEEADSHKTGMHYYKTFEKSNDVFWKIKADIQGGNFSFSPEFKELVNGMLNPNPEKRFKLKDIKESKWYNLDFLDEKSLENEMKAKFEELFKKPKQDEPKEKKEKSG